MKPPIRILRTFSIQYPFSIQYERLCRERGSRFHGTGRARTTGSRENQRGRFGPRCHFRYRLVLWEVKKAYIAEEDLVDTVDSAFMQKWMWLSYKQCQVLLSSDYWARATSCFNLTWESIHGFRGTAKAAKAKRNSSTFLMRRIDIAQRGLCEPLKKLLK